MFWSGECLLLSLVVSCSVAKLKNGAHQKAEAQPTDKFVLEGAELKTYQALFREQRRQQSHSLHSLQNVPSGTQRPKLVREALDKWVTVTAKAKQIAEQAKFEPKALALPSEAPLRDAVSKLVENCAFFSEAALRFPALVGKLFAQDAKLRSLYVWSLDFTQRMRLHDEDTQEVIDLAQQELQLVEKAPTFVNPFHKSLEQQQRELYDQLKAEEAAKKAAKSRKPSKSKHSEL